jgi:hypothetical protein
MTVPGAYIVKTHSFVIASLGVLPIYDLNLVRGRQMSTSAPNNRNPKPAGAGGAPGRTAPGFALLENYEVLTAVSLEMLLVTVLIAPACKEKSITKASSESSTRYRFTRVVPWYTFSNPPSDRETV